MATYIIWLDSREAKVFKAEGDSKHLSHVHTHGQKHATEPYGKHADGHHREDLSLFKDLAPTLSDASEILLMGPGEAKKQFQKYLGEHFTHTTAKKIVGVETVDHPTDHQILEYAQKFFKREITGVKPA